jgi:phosphatidylglycerophosphatase C
VFFASEWVPKRVVNDTAGIVELCKKAGLRTVVISASALPIVLAAAAVAGFAAADCRGIQTEVRAGKYTEGVIEPVTYAHGKVECARSLGPLALACGDSLLGDLPMLEAAKLAVAVAPRGGSPLSIEAHRRAWPVLNQDD